MIERTSMDVLRKFAAGYPVLAVTGPRQSGKTTLVRATFPEKPYVSLEDPDRLESATADPRGFLGLYPDGAVLDEAQRCPSLFSYIQTKVDLDGRSGLFVLTGSQQFGLLSKITQSLAGRVAIIELLPFSLEELEAAGKAPKDVDDLLFEGMYPPVLAKGLDPSPWFANYVMTYVERDVRQLVNIRELSLFRRFLRMCAARTGQLLNLSSLANDCGITHNTARSWLTVLEASYIVFLLPPYFRNFGKRIVKTPKIFFFDPGLAAWLIGVKDREHLAIHPMRGPLFESFAIAEIVKGFLHRGESPRVFFWRDSAGNEIDLVIERGEDLHAYEIKSGKTVSADYFRGLKRFSAIASGARVRPEVIYAGEEESVRDGIPVRPWRALPKVAVSLH